MNVHLPAPRRKWPSRLVNLTVVVIVLALAAATFVLSYPGVHAIVLQAGVSERLARLYPGLFDAVLVIACVAAVMLRDARWWARSYAWLVIIVVVAVAGATDVVHATNVALPHRKTEGVVAAAPWVLVLLGFSLMLAMLRHSRTQHASAAAAIPAPMPALSPAAPAAPVLHPFVSPTPTLASADAAERSQWDYPTIVDEAIPVPETDPDAEPIPEAEPAPVAEPVPTAEVTPAAEAPAEEEPVIGEPVSTRAEPVLLDAETPEASADTDANAEPAGLAGSLADADEAPQETTADHEPAPAAPEHATVASAPTERSHDYWGNREEHGDADQGHLPQAAPEIDQDAPPFATAPFATVPRLNRVRSTPIPPEDDED